MSVHDQYVNRLVGNPTDNGGLTRPLNFYPARDYKAGFGLIFAWE